MPNEIIHVTVFCGSHDGPASHMKAAKDLGRILADERMILVYGGGHKGLMGALADAALEAGGKVVGVMPQLLVEREWAHKKLSMFHTVPDMSKRKDMMLFMADAVIALPGGLGTLDELAEALDYRQLGINPKPVCLIDPDGFYAPLMDQMAQMQAAGYLHGGQAAMPLVAASAQEAMDALKKATA
jgi:uncharacterized protein (TIGR00730 family)